MLDKVQRRCERLLRRPQAPTTHYQMTQCGHAGDTGFSTITTAVTTPPCSPALRLTSSVATN